MIVMLLILVLALALRLISLDQSYWLDEAINVYFARETSLPFYLLKYSVGDFHPQGYFAVLWVWGHTVGFSEVATRLISVGFGVGVVFLAFLIGEIKFSRKVGILAALLCALSPILIYYSQEARMYSFAAFALSLSVYAMFKWLKNSKWWVLYVVSLALVLYSDYVAYFGLLSQIVFVAWYNKSRLWGLVGVWVASLVLFMPGIILFPEQLKSGLSTASSLEGWGNVVGGVSAKNLALVWVKGLIGRVSFDSDLVYGFWVGISSLPYFVLLVVSRRKDLVNLAGIFSIFIFLPLAVGLVVSFFVPVFNYFRYIFLVSLFFVFVAYLISLLDKKKLALAIVVGMVATESIFSGWYLLDVKFHREDWRGVAAHVNTNSGDVLVANNEVFAPLLLYKVEDVKTGLKYVPASGEDGLADVFSLADRVFYLEYLSGITDPGGVLLGKLHELGYEELSVRDFRGVGLIREMGR